MNEKLKIAVIMPSYLGFYHACASNREEKFIRAVNSFIENKHSNSFLIIVSDSCNITIKLYSELFSQNSQIKLVTLIRDRKENTFAGIVRQYGINFAQKKIKPDIICYLDTDDEIGEQHLQYIENGFIQNANSDFLYWNSFLRTPNGFMEQKTELRKNCIGVGSIAHKNNRKFSWVGHNGYHQDWNFISSCCKDKEVVKIKGPKYIIHHIPNLVDN